MRISQPCLLARMRLSRLRSNIQHIIVRWQLLGLGIYSFLCSVLITNPGWLATWQSPDPPLFGCMNKVGLLPSTGVMLSLNLKRYYEPLRLPIRPAAFSFPYTQQLMVSPPPHRVSSTGQQIFKNMPTLLPRKSMSATSVISALIQRPSPSDHRVGSSNLVYEATSRFTCVTACSIAV